MKPSLEHRAALLFLSGCIFAGATVHAQHAHIYAGAPGQNPGDALWFVNGSIFDTNSYGGFSRSPACIYLDNNLPAIYPGLYQTATTFVSLPATIFNGGPAPYAASPGAYLEMRFVSLQGPAGGSLKVWDETSNPQNPDMIFTVPAGTSSGTNRLNLSEGDPSDPQSDPYGHIHGRRITVDQPGLYTVGLQLVDTSANGPNGGPIHAPSNTNYFYFQAGLWLSDFSRSNGTVTARFGLPGFANFVFEASTDPARTNWTTVQTITGTTHSELRWVTDPNATMPNRFYRIRMGTN